MTGKKPKIVIVVGPTASGKTGLAIEIAKKFAGEVISADSRQVYRKLDIGTAKTTKKEMGTIPHHLIDVVDINDIYNATNFKNEANITIQQIVKKDKLPIIAGGTFFYIDTLLGRITTPEVPPNNELRVELEKLNTKTLVARLEKIAPNRYLTIDVNNRRRLIRAIEIAHSLGFVPEAGEIDCPYEVFTIGIKTDKEELRVKFSDRAKQWLEGGFLAEINSVLENNVSRKRLEEIGFEYKLGLQLLDSEITKDEFIQKFIEKNWQYAKRQMTWLKRDETIEWFEKDDQTVFEKVKRFLG